MEKNPPPEMRALLDRIESMERELARLRAENTHLRAGIERKDRIIAGPDSWEKIDEEHHDELDVIKPEIFWRRTVRVKYRHKTNRSLPPVVAAAPAPSIPGTLIAPALAAQIIVDKYEDHLPHYRQSRRFKRRHGVELGRQTLNGWTHATLGHLAPLGPAIRDEVLEADALQIDETPVDHLDPGHGATRKGRLWTYRDVTGETCYFDWHAGRGAECLLEFLGHDAETNTLAWNGTMHTDGYTVYDLVSRLHGLRHGGCLAHARRKFTDLGGRSPEVTVPILLWIQGNQFHALSPYKKRLASLGAQRRCAGTRYRERQSASR